MAALRHPLLILLLFGSLAFAAVPAFDLVWDDLHYLHPGSALARGSLVELVTADWSLEGPRSGYYRPVVTLSLAAETHLFGGAPAAYHLMNVVYHLATALALVWAGRRLLDSAMAAWLAGLAFALHPIHTESVAWVSGRTDVIATLFFCLAIGCYMRAPRIGSAWTLGALAAAGASILSKEPAIVLPAVLFAWELCRPARRPITVALGRVAPFVALALGALALRWLVLGAVAGPLVDADALPARLATGVTVLGHYLLLLVAPFPANPDYVLHPLAAWTAWATLVSVAALIALVATAAMAWRWSRVPALLVAWLLLTAGPSTPLLPVGPVHMAERFLYLPSAAFAMALGWAGAGALAAAGLHEWRDLRAASSVRALAVGGTVAVVLIAGLAHTAYRCEDWRDAERLFTRMAASSPSSWKAANGLGHVYEGRGQLAAAAVEYGRAVALNPGALQPVLSLALVESRMGLHEQAARRAEAIRRLDPDGAAALQVAWIHSNAGQHDEAAAALAVAAARQAPGAVGRTTP
jgi:protein O-mannosyl-transferase